MERLCICPKDIEIVLGKSERQARNILNKIKTVLAKKKHQSVTFEEFCDYQGLKLIEVKTILKIK
jgi:ABC-type metal ion transport system substrate-binding protein